MDDGFYYIRAPRIGEKTLWSGPFDRVLLHAGPSLVRLLAVPILPPEPFSQKHPGASYQSLSDGQNASSSEEHEHAAAPLLRLPSELHDCIFSSLEDVDDIVCLGLASRHFWSIGRRYMHQHYMSFYGRWARTNLFYATYYLPLDDIPPGVFSEDEIKQQQQEQQQRQTLKLSSSVPTNTGDLNNDSTPEDPHLDYADDVLVGWCGSDFEDSDEENGIYGFDSSNHNSDLAFMVECDRPRTTGMSFLGYKARDRVNRLCATRPGITMDPAWACVQDELHVHESIYFPPDQPWILRNWTAREIVRTDALALDPKLIHGPCTHALGLGDAVALRTARVSKARFTQTAKKPPVCLYESTHGRGVWAGHCFDIVLQSEHEKQIAVGHGGAGWRDVSEEVAQEWAGIYESRHGPEWQAALLQCDRQGTCRLY